MYGIKEKKRFEPHLGISIWSIYKPGLLPWETWHCWTDHYKPHFYCSDFSHSEALRRIAWVPMLILIEESMFSFHWCQAEQTLLSQEFSMSSHCTAWVRSISSNFEPCRYIDPRIVHKITERDFFGDWKKVWADIRAGLPFGLYDWSLKHLHTFFLTCTSTLDPWNLD